MQHKQAGQGRGVQKRQPAEVEVEIAHGVLPSERSLCDLDKVVGGLVVEVAGDPNGGRPCGSGDCQGIGHGFSWGSVTELFLSARADSAANSRRRQRGHSLRLLTQKVEGGKQCGRRNTPGGEDIALRKSTTWAMSSAARTSQGGGEVSFLLHAILIFGICG